MLENVPVINPNTDLLNVIHNRSIFCKKKEEEKEKMN